MFVCEGEKDCDLLASWNLAATCNPGGAGKWRAEYTKYFTGRDAVIVPDNDAAGRRHAYQVAESLIGTAASVKLVTLPGLEEKGDVSGWIRGGHTAEDLLAQAAQTSNLTDGDLRRWAQDHGVDSGGAALSPRSPVEPLDPKLVPAPGGELGTPEAQEVARLAGLDPITYDRQRPEAAERLGIRVATLDNEVRRLKGQIADDQQEGIAFDLTDPEEGPTTVDGAQLLDEMVLTINRYVASPEFAVEVVVLWTLHAHTHDASFISPILAITSPVLGCGKTTLLMLVSALTPRSLPVANLTTASLFRAVEKWKPTLLIDEADTYLRENEELRGVLNSGHNRAGAWILRCVGEDHEPRNFSTWAPKAIALIGKLPRDPVEPKRSYRNEAPY